MESAGIGRVEFAIIAAISFGDVHHQHTKTSRLPDHLDRSLEHALFIHRNVKKEMDEKRMLERTVELVRQARSLGVLVVHITEGYSSDYRELDPTNPGGFHRGQILRQAWKIGTKEQSYYEPLVPGPGDKDLVLPPRI